MAGEEPVVVAMAVDEHSKDTNSTSTKERDDASLPSPPASSGATISTTSASVSTTSPTSATSTSTTASALTKKNKNDDGEGKSSTSKKDEEPQSALATMLANALREAEDLRRALAQQERRAAKAERVLDAIGAASPASSSSSSSPTVSPRSGTSTNASADKQTASTPNGMLVDGSEGAEGTVTPALPSAAASPSAMSKEKELLKEKEKAKEKEARKEKEKHVAALVDAEERVERAERARDVLASNLSTLLTQWSALDRYLALNELRAADARAAFGRVVQALASPPAGSSYLNNADDHGQMVQNLSSQLQQPPPAAPTAPSTALTANLPYPWPYVYHPQPLPSFAPGSNQLIPAPRVHHHPDPNHPPPPVAPYGALVMHGGLAVNTGLPPPPGAGPLSATVPNSARRGTILQNGSSSAAPSASRGAPGAGATFQALPLPPPPSAATVSHSHSSHNLHTHGQHASSSSSMLQQQVPAKRSHRALSSSHKDGYDGSKRSRTGEEWREGDRSPASATALSPHLTHPSSSSANPSQALTTSNPLASFSSRDILLGNHLHDHSNPLVNMALGPSMDAHTMPETLSSSARRLAGYPSSGGRHRHIVSPPLTNGNGAQMNGAGGAAGAQGGVQVVPLGHAMAVHHQSSSSAHTQERERDGRYLSVNGHHHRHRDGRQRDERRGRDRGGRERNGRSRDSSADSLSIDEMLIEATTDNEAHAPTPSAPHGSQPPLPHQQGAPHHQMSTTPQAQVHGGRGRAHTYQGQGVVQGQAQGQVGGRKGVLSLALTDGNIPPQTAPAPTQAAQPPQPTVAPLPGGGYPPTNAQGQRICRQCGMAGRYKEGKCVEKWGPGPEGPGTVCDRCRKKMKRVERRGTLDASQLLAQQRAQAQAQSQQNLQQSQSQSQSQIQTQTSQSHISSSQRATPPQRQDTVIVGDLPPPPSSSTRERGYTTGAVNSGREREREREKGYRDSRQHSSQQSQAYPPSNSASQHTNGSNSAGSGRRAQTPPYINSISTREQQRQYRSISPDAPHAHRPHRNEHEHDDQEQDLLDAEGDAEGELDVDAEIARTLPSSSSQGREGGRGRERTSTGSSSLSALSAGEANGVNGSSPPSVKHHANGAGAPVMPRKGTGGLSVRSNANGWSNGSQPQSHSAHRKQVQHHQPQTNSQHQSQRRYEEDDDDLEIDLDADAEGDADADADADAEVDADGDVDMDGDADAEGDLEDLDADLMDAVDASVRPGGGLGGARRVAVGGGRMKEEDL